MKPSIDTEALARDCHRAARAQAAAHLTSHLQTVHVITTLGPVNHAAHLVPARIGYIPPRFGYQVRWGR